MTTIKLLDARRGLNLKCRELFRDEKVAETIYRYLCDGIEECEDAQPERKRGKWIDGYCSVCGCDVPAYIEDWRWVKDMKARFCPMCGADMRGGNDETD